MSLAIGSMVDGRYRILRSVGVGGFGEVFEAQQVALDAIVALKTVRLSPDLPPEDRAHRVGLLLEEARHLAKLRHPNVVGALDAGVAHGPHLATPYFVLEWCSGATFGRHLAATPGRRSVADAWALMEPIVLALAHAHDMGIVHRDLKPSNIMLETRDGVLVPRIIDFGIAKAFEADAEAGSGFTETMSPSSPHTPAYAAPEQVVGARTGPWTDVHAVGLLFVEVLTGAPAYCSDLETIEAISFAAVSPARPTPASQGCDAGAFEAVIERALALQPRDRYPDARALFAALAEAAQAMDLPHGALEPAPEPICELPQMESEEEAGPASITVASSRAPRALAKLSRSARPAAAQQVRMRARRPVVLLASAGLVVALVIGTVLFAGVGEVVLGDATPAPRAITQLPDLQVDDMRARLQRQLGAQAEAFSWDESVGPEDMRLVAWGAGAGEAWLGIVAPTGDWELRLEEKLREQLDAQREAGREVAYAVEGHTWLVVGAPDAPLAAQLLSALVEGAHPTRRSDGKDSVPPSDGGP